MAQRKSRIKCLILSSQSEENSLYKTLMNNHSNAVLGKLSIELFLYPNNISFSHIRLKDAEYKALLNSVDLILVELEKLTPSLYYEIGVARAIGKPIVFIGREPIIYNLPEFIRNSYFIFYRDEADIANQLKQFLSEYIKYPKRFAPTPFIEADVNSNIEIDLDRIDTRDFENLCFELLSKLGYKRLEWHIKDDYFDAVSTLRKKDPDGYEYNEYWVICFADELENKHVLDVALHDLSYFSERILRDIYEPGIFNSGILRNEREDIPITFLFISRKKELYHKRLIKEFSSRSLKYSRRGHQSMIRFRIWDEQVITSLVNNNLQLARKYFSSEALTKSGVRLSYEELYKQNLGMYEQLQKTNEALIAEKNRAELLERDAAWKLLSFTAAHRLGNPIDAIDSELSNLKTAIKLNKINLVKEILDSIDTPVEKAKAIVSQFRNLSIAHEIQPEVINEEKLNEALKQSGKQAIDKNVVVNFDLNAKAKLSLDILKLSECFDEIVRNSLHFVSGEEQKIDISTKLIKAKDLPANIDKTKNYIKIAFADNGCGIPIEKKEEIFKPFERSYIHGTGLGLSFCEVIINKHGGIIREVGKFGSGATFEIILPIERK